MPARPQKPGKVPAGQGQGNRANISLGGLAGAAGGGAAVGGGLGGLLAGGLSGGGTTAPNPQEVTSAGSDYVPPTYGNGQPAPAAQLQPYSVNHPILDMLLNGGRGTATAMQLNNQRDLATFQAGANSALQDQIAQGNIKLEDARGTQARLTSAQESTQKIAEANNTSRNTIAQGDAGMKNRAGATSTADWSSPDSEVPRALAATTANDTARAGLVANSLSQPAAQDASNIGVNSQLMGPTATAGTTLQPGQFHFGYDMRTASPMTASGPSQPGVTTTQSTTTDPKTLAKTEVTKTIPVPGTPGMVSAPVAKINANADYSKPVASGGGDFGTNDERDGVDDAPSAMAPTPVPQYVPVRDMNGNITMQPPPAPPQPIQSYPWAQPTNNNPQDLNAFLRSLMQPQPPAY